MNPKSIILAVVFLFAAVTVVAQNGMRTITGTVTDDVSGEAIYGAAITMKGNTTIGVISGYDGKYSITLPDSAKVLMVSFVGFVTQEVPLSPNVNIVNVVMPADAMELSEVVVIGYGAQKKGSITGSYSKISSSVSTVDTKKGSGTWKRSGMPENSIRLEVGDNANDFLPLQAAQMAVQIDGFRVRVLMDCFFFNDKKDGLEGTFKLRLPAGAIPYYFAFGETAYIDDERDDDGAKDKKRTVKPYGRRIPYTQYSPEEFDLSPEAIGDTESRSWEDVKEARIVSKQKAARAYESTVSARIDPALMEWAGADMFSCRVFPLSRGKLHRVVIGYDLNMTEALDFREYIMMLPTAIDGVKVDLDIYASSGMTPAITPAITARQIDNRLYATVQNPKGKEYAIRYNTVDPIILCNTDSSYFGANFRINLPEVKQSNLPSDAVFLLDVSLSSQPDKFNVWLKLMEEILTENYDVIKNFSVLCFNVETFWWNKQYVRNNYDNVQQFLDFANTLALEGATDLGAALNEAANPEWLKKEKNLSKHIFLMSDADFNWGESNMNTLKKFIREGDRIHTYKTGLPGTNTTVLDYLSKMSGGFSFTVTGEDEVQLTAKSFRFRPWMIERIDVEGVTDFLISGQPSQLYNGQKLILGGRGVPKGTVKIRVNNGEQTQDIVLAANEKITSNLSTRVYGQLALSQLENFSFQTEEATEAYATHFRVPNATMSFLMLESEYDYNRFGIDSDDAEDFVDENTVENIVAELLKNSAIAPLDNGKANFIAWLNQLKTDPEMKFKPDSAFWTYVNSLPDEAFDIKRKPLRCRLRFTEQQRTIEKEALADENMKYDNLLPIAAKRKSGVGRADALKLLSSVIERNPGDFIALRDLAIKAIEWGFADQSYYMMQRVVANRRYEAVAYLTAADALAKSGNVEMAIVYYYICSASDWDSDYGSFTEVANLQFYRFLNDVRSKKNGVWSSEVWSSNNNNTISPTNANRVNATLKYADKLYRRILDDLDFKDLLIDQADVVLIANWNTNNTDVDLHVFEPTGEECYYGNSKTKIGGKLTIDVTEGYGPEMYVLRHVVDGEYSVKLDYYSDDDTKTSSKTKVYLDFYQNWGCANEKVTRKTIVLESSKDSEEVLRFEVKNLRIK